MKRLIFALVFVAALIAASVAQAFGTGHGLTVGYSVTACKAFSGQTSCVTTGEPTESTAFSKAQSLFNGGYSRVTVTRELH